MISVKVSYTVKPDFVSNNQQNIGIFLAEFKKMTSLNFLYNVYLQADGLTFLHLSMYENEEVQQQVLNVPSFLKFQKERDESGLTNNPTIEILDLIGSSMRQVY
jgi:hypothetical protein